MIQVHEILTVTEGMGDPGTIVWQLRCPKCGEDCVERCGGDSEAVTVSPDRDRHDSPIGTRGGFVRVELFCPTGHGFDLIIANHKGLEFVGIKMVGPRDYASLPQTQR